MLPEDPYVQLAADLFNVPVEEVTREMRSRAKAVNFGLCYGTDLTVFTAGEAPTKTWEARRERYRKMFPGAFS